LLPVRADFSLLHSVLPHGFLTYKFKRNVMWFINFLLNYRKRPAIMM
jgi:hypothetical protein